MYMIEILAEALNDEPSEHAILNACSTHKGTVAFGTRWLDAYRSSELEPVPLKSASEFRPAFLVDYEGRQPTPYSRELDFVQRSLLYAYSVAVIDELQYWSSRSIDDLQVHWGMGYPQYNNLAASALRVLYYGELEKLGLLYYVDYPQYPDRGKIAKQLSSEDISDLVPIVFERCGYVFKEAALPSFLKRDLSLWFQQLQCILQHEAIESGYVDPFLPNWFARPELLDWVAKQSKSWLSNDTLANSYYLNELLHLPAPSAEAMHRFTPRDMADFRDHELFGVWREDLQKGLKILATKPATVLEAADCVKESQDYLSDRHDRLRRKIDQSIPLKSALRSAFTTGIGISIGATAISAALSPSDAVSHIVSSTVTGITMPLACELGKALIRRLAGSRPDEKTLSCHYHLFVDGSLTGWTGEKYFDKPPSNFMTDVHSGRPLAFDLFDLR